MISSVYFSNEATREQLERRINRLSQNADTIRIILIHAGIISYVHEKYEGVRNMALALKGFARDFGEEIEA
jgi:3-dehydroquinate synthase class II